LRLIFIWHALQSYFRFLHLFLNRFARFASSYVLGFVAFFGHCQICDIPISSWSYGHLCGFVSVKKIGLDWIFKVGYVTFVFPYSLFQDTVRRLTLFRSYWLWRLINDDEILWGWCFIFLVITLRFDLERF